MITLGNEIIPLQEHLGVPWSKFAFMLRYPDWSVLLHSLTSTTIACDEATTQRILTNEVAGRDKKDLQKNLLTIKTSADDEILFRKVSAKVARHLEKASVTTLLLVVTDSCNLRCTYCFENLPQFSKRQSMSPQKMKEAVDYFLSLGRGEKSVFFYGGEPLTEWKNVRQCIEYIRTRYKNRRVNIQITTNGTIHPKGIIEFCGQNDVTIGVSIDGPQRITNDARRSKARGLDVFTRAFKLIRDCRDAGLNYAALCTISRESAEHLEEITDFFIAENITNLGFNITVRCAGESVEEDLSFWDGLGQQMAFQHQKLLARGIFEPKGIRYLRGIAEGRFSIAECDAGYRGEIAVNPDGLIGPCQAFLHNPDFWIPLDPGTNVRNHPLWSRFSQGTTLEIASCERCPFVGTCGGGCRYNRNDFRQPNSNFCQYIRSFLYHTLSNFRKEVIL